MKNNNSNTSKIIVGVLMVLLLGLLGYMYLNNTELQKSNDFLEDEKVKIEQDLDEMIAKYDTAINDNSTLAEALKMERNDIVMFRDSVKNLKQTNYSIIRRYREKIKKLEDSNARLFKANDSLRVSNRFLTNEIDSAKVFIKTQTALIDTLNIQKTELIGKIEIGARLQANSIKTVPMRERNSGKLNETKRASRTDALRISFTIAENNLAEAGEKNAIIQVLNPKGIVVHGIGKETLENGEQIIYTDKMAVTYNKQNIDVISLVEVNRKEMVKGIHTVNVFLGKQLVARSKFELK